MLGMSQKRLAEALGISAQQVQKYEKGRNRLSASRLQQIADVLEVAPTYFFEGPQHGDRKSAALPKFIWEFLATPGGLELIRILLRLRNPKFQQRLVALAKELPPRD